MSEDAPVEDEAREDAMLTTKSVLLAGRAASKPEAIDEAGKLLVAAGAVDEAYIAAMHEREKEVSTYMGRALAIPHGTRDTKSIVRRSAVSFIRYDDGIDWDGDAVVFVVGVAGADDTHLKLLKQVARIFLDDEQVVRLRQTDSPEEVAMIFAGTTTD